MLPELKQNRKKSLIVRQKCQQNLTSSNWFLIGKSSSSSSCFRLVNLFEFIFNFFLSRPFMPIWLDMQLPLEVADKNPITNRAMMRCLFTEAIVYPIQFFHRIEDDFSVCNVAFNGVLRRFGNHFIPMGDVRSVYREDIRIDHKDFISQLTKRIDWGNISVVRTQKSVSDPFLLLLWVPLSDRF